VIVDLLKDDNSEIKSRVVLRLSTSSWLDKRGFHVKKDLSFLKRECIGFNGLEHDAEVSGGDVVGTIINLYDVPDGVYEAVVTNVSHDFESGLCDDWDWQLIPYSVGSNND
jgi:hypothetical protein